MTAEGKLRLRQGLGDLEKRLSCPPFFRVSRSAMVNLSWIDHLAPMFSGTYSAFLKEPVEMEVHVSRCRARELRQLLGWCHRRRALPDRSPEQRAADRSAVEGPAPPT